MIFRHLQLHHLRQFEPAIAHSSAAPQAPGFLPANIVFFFKIILQLVAFFGKSNIKKAKRF
jgi:hypothetical protein